MRRKRAQNPEQGFALLFVFAMAAAVAISLYLELPRAAFEAQRAKEDLLIQRGEQYKRAIQLFSRQFGGRYPPSLEALENTNSRRFLRRRYKDPMTGKDEWRLIHGANGFFTDSVTQAPPKQPLQPGATEPAKQEGAAAAAPESGDPQMPAGPISVRRRRASDSGVPMPQVQQPPPDTDQGPAPEADTGPGEQQPPPEDQAGQPGQPGTLQPGQPGFQPLQPGQQPVFQPGLQAGFGQAQPGLQPGSQPLQPGQPGFQPGQPGQPGYQPGFQTVQPGQPGFQPGQPGQPGYQPGFQTVQPGQPGYQPGFQPAQPGQQGFQPGYQQPGQPGQPGFQPLQPGQIPQQPGVPGQPQQSGQLTVTPGLLPPQPYQPSPQQAYYPQQPQQQYQAGQTPTGGARVYTPGGQLQRPPQSAQQLIQNLLTNPRQPPGGSFGGGQQFGPGIAGVASTLEAEGIKVYNDRTKYNEWEFLYDPRKDLTIIGMTGGLGGPAVGGGVVTGTGTGIGQGTGFGQGSGSQQQLPFRRQGR